MPQHREVSPKDLGLSAEDQELMRLGDVYQDPDKRNSPLTQEDDDVQFSGDVYQDPERPRSAASGREDSDRLDTPGNPASRENDDEAGDAEE